MAPRTEVVVTERESDEEDKCCNGGYGWWCVASVFLINAHTWGINGSFGIFLAYYLESDFFKGASSLTFALVGGLSVSQALLVSPVTTLITQNFGLNTTLLLGVSLQFLGLLGASFATKVWQLCLSQGLCFGWGMGLLFTASVSIPSLWFSSKRGLANGLSTAGSGLGGLVYSLGTQAMIQTCGLSWAFRILALVSTVVNLGSALVLRYPPSHQRPQTKAVTKLLDLQLFRRPGFILITVWGALSVIGYTIIQFSLPDYATSIGLSSESASLVGALLSLGQAIGRPLVGYFGDRFGRRNVTAIATCTTGMLALVYWMFAKDFASLASYSLITGLCFGTFWSTISTLMADEVGVGNLAPALSMLWLLLIAPSTGAELVALLLKRPSGDIYLFVKILTGGVYLGAGLCIFALQLIRTR